MNQIADGSKDINTSSVGVAFRRRARHLRYQGFAILGLIVLLLGAAIWIFFSAAEITKQDVAVEEVLKRSSDIEALIAELEGKIPPRPEFLEPVYKATEEDEQNYADIFSAIKVKGNEFNELLFDIDQSVLERISNRQAEIDRGYFNLKSVVQLKNRREYEVYPSLDGAVKSRFLMRVGWVIIVHVYFTRPTDRRIV